MGTSVNEYSSFTYEKAPDLEKAFNAVADPNAWASATEQMMANSKMRSANAAQAQKNFDMASKISVKLAGAYVDRAEKRDQRLMNEAYQLHLEAGITQAKLRSYNARNKDKAGFQKDVGLYNELAVKARAEGDHVLADKLEDMNGHKLLMAKQSLLRQAAINWRSGFEGARDDIKITRADGSTLTYGNVKTEGDYNELVREYNIRMGFTDVSWAQEEFIDEEFRKTMEREQHYGLIEWRKTANKQRVSDRQESWRNALITAAKTNQLGQQIHELETMQFAYSSDNTQAGMRKDLTLMLADLINQNKLDPTKGIPPEALASFHNYRFHHKGDDKEVGLYKYREYRDLDDHILAFQRDRLTKNAQQKELIGLEAVAQLDAIVEEHGRPTEYELAETIRNFEETHNIKAPQELVKYLTVEDQDDNEIVSALEAKISLGIPLTTEDWMNINDSGLREQWKKEAQGPRGSGIQTGTKRDAALERAVGTKLNQLGLGTKNKEYGIMLANATAEYNKLYMQYAANERFENTADLHDYVIQKVEQNIDRGRVSGVRKPADDPRKFTQELTQGREFLLDAHKTGANIPALLQQELLPGSEEQYLRVERFAKDPINTPIPLYYKKIAESHNGMDAYDVMNFQYMSQNNGKELPKNPMREALEKENPYVQAVVKSKGASYKSITRAQKIASHYDFNTADSLIEGVVA